MMMKTLEDNPLKHLLPVKKKPTVFSKITFAVPSLPFSIWRAKERTIYFESALNLPVFQ